MLPFPLRGPSLRAGIVEVEEENSCGRAGFLLRFACGSLLELDIDQVMEGRLTSRQVDCPRKIGFFS